MKIKINKKCFAFTGILMFSILIFNNSCQKNTSPVQNPTKPFAPATPTGSKIIYTDVDSISSSVARQITDLNNVPISNVSMVASP